MVFIKVLNAKANLYNHKNLDLRVMDMLQSMLKGINVVTKPVTSKLFKNLNEDNTSP
jgi:hypothetical protein